MVFLPKEVDHDAPAACPPPAPPAKHRPLSIAAVVYRAWALARCRDYGSAAAALPWQRGLELRGASRRCSCS
eukprot:3341890-Alexandrium_andersonii.AAC.1